MRTTKTRILVVDDEVGFTRFLKLNLDGTGRYDTRVENCAREALAAAREFHPDLILLDVMMPGMDGGDVGARLQKDPVAKDIPIVFVTAAVQKGEVVSRHGVIGGLHFVAKPVAFEDLLDVIEDRLSRTVAAHSRVRWAEVVALPDAPPLRVPIPPASPPGG